MNDAHHHIQSMRREYACGELTDRQAGDDPIALFERWFEQARAEIPDQAAWYETNAFTLATVDPTGRPSARVVLVKDFDAAGLVFFTNYRSHKARHIESNPHVAMCFHWPWLERQVRLDGRAVPVQRAESEAYFKDRPRSSQLGAWVSDQSEPITRHELARRLAELERQYANRPVPCPPHWGGYRVAPDRIEFWQGRPNRLHDRLVFERSIDRWARQRIGP